MIATSIQPSSTESPKTEGATARTPQDSLLAKLPKPQQRIPELDGLRGLACLMVMFWHYGWDLSGMMPFGGYFLAVLVRMWWTGVDLFFVLSGFLIGGALWDNKDSPNLFVTFYVRRSCRIFPLYFTWIAIGVVLARLFPEITPLSAVSEIPLFSYILFISNIFHVTTGAWGTAWLGAAWSLAVEEQFYLLLPFLIWFFSRRSIPGILIILSLSAWLYRLFVLIYYPTNWQAVYFLLPGRMDSLLLGVLAAIVVRDELCVGLIRNNIWVLRFLFGILGLGLALFSHRWQYVHSPIYIGVGYTWTSFFYLNLLLLAFYERSVSAFFRSRLLIFFGSISYGVYLIHQPVLKIIGFLVINRLTGALMPLALILSSVIVSTTLAWLTFFLLEKHFVTFGHRWRYDRPSATS